MLPTMTKTQAWVRVGRSPGCLLWTAFGIRVSMSSSCVDILGSCQEKGGCSLFNQDRLLSVMCHQNYDESPQWWENCTPFSPGQKSICTQVERGWLCISWPVLVCAFICSVCARAASKCSSSPAKSPALPLPSPCKASVHVRGPGQNVFIIHRRCGEACFWSLVKKKLLIYISCFLLVSIQRRGQIHGPSLGTVRVTVSTVWAKREGLGSLQRLPLTLTSGCQAFAPG